MRSPVALAIATALFVTGMPSAHAEVVPSTSPVVVWPADTTVGPDQPYEVGVTWSGTETLVAEVVTDAGTERVPLLVPDLPGTPTTTDVARGNGTGTVAILACATEDPEDCTATFPDGEHTHPISRVTGTTVTVDPLPAFPHYDQLHPSSGITLRTRPAATDGPPRTFTLRRVFTRQGDGQQRTFDEIGPANLPADGVITDPFTVKASELGDGTWDLALTLAVTDPEFSPTTLPEATVHTSLAVDITGPKATLGAAPGVIHPLVNVPGWPGSLRATASGDVSEIAGWLIRRNTGGTVVRTVASTSPSFVWDGRDNSGKVVPAASYRINTVDARGNISAGSTLVGVTDKKLVTKVGTKVISARASLEDYNVGRCSVLKSPSLRGGTGTIGYYSNVKCRRKAQQSRVATIHGTALPRDAYSIDAIRVYAFGGAGTKRPKSRATLYYLTNRGLPRLKRTMTARVGAKAGAVTPSPSAYILSFPGKRLFYWGVTVQGGNQYDLRDFAVRITYRIIV